MGRYLIAGAAGYVGAQLAEQLLRQGHAVRGLVRDPDHATAQRLAGLGMAVWQGDLTEPESLVGVANGVDVVYNLTARSLLDNGSVRRVFVDGNRNLIAACSRARSVRAYLFTGNLAPYGDQGDAWVDEDTPAAPNYPLGQVLAEAEQAILELVRAHRFPAMILRVATVYGPERDPIDSIATGTATLIGDGRNYTARIHIEDLLQVLQRAAFDGEPGAIYNVGDDDPLRAVDLYAEVRRRLGMLPPRTYSKDVALASGLDPSVVGMASASVRLSNARLKHDLGMRLRHPSVRGWLAERLGRAEPELELALGH